MEDSNSNQKHSIIIPQNSQDDSDDHLAEADDDLSDDCCQPLNKTLPTLVSDLSEVPVKYALSPHEALVAIKDHVFHKHQEILDSIPDQAAELEIEGQLQSNDPHLPEISPPSATQSISSITSTSQQYLSVGDNRVQVDVLDKENQNSFKLKSLSIVPVSKKASHDGYNWRKYGQKQVKSPEGSRSYYRCTHGDCYAKKIECSDCTNRVIDTVYKSPHNHDPPSKVSYSPKSKLLRSPKSRPSPSIDHGKPANSSTGPNDAVPSTSLITYGEQRSSTSSSKEKCGDGPDEKSEINVDDEDTNEAEPRKRLKKKSDPNSSQALSKSRKKPKLVVHAAGDVVTSGDGFRWRKYGQKMVKGNPHPRNYYRCTSAGCPVRKYIERAVDDPIAAIITYKGVHDHDMPVPKKRQDLPSALIVATAVGDPVPLSSLQVKRCEQLQNRLSTTKWSVDKVSEMESEASEHENVMEIPSARTLVSVGFEIKPC